jgi:hypothetical protein
MSKQHKNLNDTLPTPLGYSLAVSNQTGELVAVGGPDGETVFDSTLEASAVLESFGFVASELGTGALHVVALVPVRTLTAHNIDPAVPAD